MRPLGVRVSRRERRRKWKGMPTGRHAVKAVETTYGRGQRRREWEARIAAVFAARRGDQEENP